jgi:hypothetical protein
MTDREQEFWDHIFSEAFGRRGSAIEAEAEARIALEARRKAAKPAVVPAFARPPKAHESQAAYKAALGLAPNEKAFRD